MAHSRDEAYGACLTQLRATDFDRYLACLLMPAERRGAVAALYAFNAELARVRDLIREPLPGEIRLQWWRDFIDRPEQGENLANPVAAGLFHAIEEHGLPRTALSVMTEARIFDLYDDPMPDRAAFELYAGETASALVQLSGLVLDPINAPAIAEAAGHAGIAQLVAGCLLLMPVHLRRHQVYLPGDILAATGIDAAQFVAGDDAARKAALSAFIGYGRDHLARARQAAPPLGREIAAAFTPVALAETIFARAEAAGPELCRTPIQPSQLSRQWRMWRALRRRKF